MRSRKKKRVTSAMLTLNVAKLVKRGGQMRSDGVLKIDLGTYRKMKVTMNQEAKKIPIALSSVSGSLA